MNLIKYLETARAEFAKKQLVQREIVPRHEGMKELAGKVSVAIGMRRVGKTTLMLQRLQQHLDAGVPLSQILYINFEDDRLQPFSEEQFGCLVDAFYQLYPENHERDVYLFFDEVQNVQGNWALVVRRLLDTKQVSIYLTGSSAKLLSKEIATSLRGRSIVTEVWPFSFDEYLLSRKEDLPAGRSRQAQDLRQMQLSHYLDESGFPEVFRLAIPERRELLQQYVDVVVLRDVVERYDISNISLIRYLINTLVHSVGQLLSITKLYNDTKSQGFKTSRTTVYQYIDYLQDTFMVFLVPLYSSSVRKAQSNPRKVYCIDNGLYQAWRIGRQANWGARFENQIYLDLRRAGCKIFYYLTEDRCEVDFLIQDVYGELRLIQVCWDLTSDSTLAREETALQKAEQEQGIDGIIVTPENYTEFLRLLTQKPL